MNKILKKISALMVSIIMIMQGSYVFAFTKNETIYSVTESNGKIKTSVINSQLKLKSNEENSNIEDNTELENIINLNGDEKFTLKGNLLQWTSMSNDIFYQGTMSKLAPISISIKYYLNGKEIKIDDLEGKSGNVTLKITFTNNLKNNVTVNGKKEILYTPFVVAVGAIFSNETCSNIEVSNGKAIDTGTKNMLVGIASPGLYDSLKIDEFKNLDEVEIKFETEEFSSSATMYIAATPKLIEDADLKIFDKLDDLVNNINVLQKNMNTIEDAAKQINEGADSLLKGTEDIASGSVELNNGAKTLEDGAKALSTNLKTVAESVSKLKSGAVSVDEGISQIISEIEKSEKIFSSNEFQSSMKTLEYLKTTNISTANKIENAYTAYNLAGLSIDQIMAMPGAYLGLSENASESQINETKAGLITAKSNYESGIVTLLKGNANAIGQVENNLTTISDSLTQLKTAIQKVQNEGTSVISTGLTQLDAGMTKLYGGSNELSSGATKLAKGTTSLSEGANKLSNGAKTLSNGTSELSDGISKFNTQGINKLSSYASKINNYEGKIKKLVDLSKNYKGYSCNNADVTTFIYAVKK